MHRRAHTHTHLHTRTHTHTHLHTHTHTQVLVAGQGTSVETRILSEANWLFNLIGQVRIGASFSLSNILTHFSCASYCVWTHLLLCMLKLICAHTHICSHSYVLTHVLTLICAHTHMCSHSYVLTRICAHTHMCSHSNFTAGISRKAAATYTHAYRMTKIDHNHIYTVYIPYFWQGSHQIYGYI